MTMKVAAPTKQKTVLRSTHQHSTRGERVTGVEQREGAHQAHDQRGAAAANSSGAMSCGVSGAQPAWER